MKKVVIQKEQELSTLKPKYNNVSSQVDILQQKFHNKETEISNLQQRFNQLEQKRNGLKEKNKSLNELIELLKEKVDANDVNTIGTAYHEGGHTLLHLLFHHKIDKVFVITTKHAEGMTLIFMAITLAKKIKNVSFRGHLRRNNRNSNRT